MNYVIFIIFIARDDVVIFAIFSIIRWMTSFVVDDGLLLHSIVDLGCMRNG